MVVTENKFNKLSEMYENLIKQFLILHNVKEVVCTDTKEHFFDRIVVAENGSMKKICSCSKETENMKSSISCSTKRHKQPINIH